VIFTNSHNQESFLIHAFLPKPFYELDQLIPMIYNSSPSPDRVNKSFIYCKMNERSFHNFCNKYFRTNFPYISDQLFCFFANNESAYLSIIYSELSTCHPSHTLLKLHIQDWYTICLRENVIKSIFWEAWSWMLSKTLLHFFNQLLKQLSNIFQYKLYSLCSKI
jgi:hypothetical protein